MQIRHKSATPSPVKVKSYEEDRKEMQRHRTALHKKKSVQGLQSSDSLASIASTTLYDLVQQTCALDDDEDALTELLDDEEMKPEIVGAVATPKRKVVRWQDAVQSNIAKATPTKSRRLSTPRQIMPGTLNTPSPGTSFATNSSQASDASSDAIFYKNEDEDIPASQILGTTPITVSTPSLDRRLMPDDEERLLQEICDTQSPGFIITVPKGLDLKAKRAGEKTGLFTRLRVLPDPEESFLVLGTDEREVERLWLTLLKIEGHADPYRFASLGGLSGGIGAGVTGLGTPKNTASAQERKVSAGGTPIKFGYAAAGAVAGGAVMFLGLAS